MEPLRAHEKLLPLLGRTRAALYARMDDSFWLRPACRKDFAAE